MAAAQNLAHKNNELANSPESARPEFEVYENPNPPETSDKEPALQVVDGGAELELESSTDPRILLEGKEKPVTWVHTQDTRLLREMAQIFTELGERELRLEIKTQSNADEMARSLRMKLREKLTGHYPYFEADIERNGLMFAGQSGAPVMYVVVSSHGDRLDDLAPSKSNKHMMAAVYSERDVALTGIHKNNAPSLTLGAPGMNAGASDNLTRELADKIQPEGEYILVRYGADNPQDTMPISAQMKLNKDHALGELKDTAAATPTSLETTKETLKEQEMQNRFAQLDILTEAVRHPDVNPKMKKQVLKQLEGAITEISKPEVLENLSLATQLRVTDKLRDITREEEPHPLMQELRASDPQRAAKMTTVAKAVAQEVEKHAPEGVLKTLRREVKADVSVSANPQITLAIMKSRLNQVQVLFEKEAPETAAEQAAELIDDRTIKAVEAQPALKGVSEQLTAVQAKIEPVRRRTALKSEAPQVEELKVIDPKGSLKVTPKAQEALRNLQQQLKADPKMRAELAQNKELAPLVEAIEKVDFAKPTDVAKLAAQIAKLPKEARAEITKIAPPEFAEAAEEITNAVTLEAILPKLQEPIDTLKDAPIEPEQKEKLEALAQKLAEIKDPEALKEIVQQLQEIIADLPREIISELPQLKEITEISFAAVEPSAVELQASMEVLQKLDLEPAQQEKLEALAQQIEVADPAALKEIAEQLKEIIADLPPEVVAELPQLKELTEVIAKFESDPVSFDQFISKSVEQHADIQIEAIERVEAVHLAADVGAKIELTLDALKELPLDAEGQKQLKEIAQQLEGADPAELKAIIAKLDELVKVLPPEVSKQLPPAISEIQEGLKSADLSSLSKADISPQQRADISAKLNLTMSALEETPLRPADRKQLQEITQQLASGNPAEMRRAIKQLDQLTKALPPEIKLPPAMKELRESLRAVEQPMMPRGLQSALKAEFSPAAPRPVEFTAPAQKAVRQLQEMVRSAPAMEKGSLPFTPRQIETLAKADISKPAGQQQVATVLREVQTQQANAPAANENKAPQTAVQQQLQKILRQPEVRQQLAQQGATQNKNASTTAPANQNAKPTAQSYGVTISQTMSSANLHRIANDPNAPMEMRLQAHAWYLQQLQREKKQDLDALLKQNDNAPKLQATQPQARIQITEDIKAIAGQVQVLQKQLEQQEVVSRTVETSAPRTIAETTNTTTIIEQKNQPNETAYATTMAPTHATQLDAQAAAGIVNAIQQQAPPPVVDASPAPVIQRAYIETPTVPADAPTVIQPDSPQTANSSGSTAEKQDYIGSVTDKPSHAEETFEICPFTGLRGKVCTRDRNKNYHNVGEQELAQEIKEKHHEAGVMDHMEKGVITKEAGEGYTGLPYDNPETTPDEQFMCDPSKCGKCPRQGTPGCPKHNKETMERTLSEVDVIPEMTPEQLAKKQQFQNNLPGAEGGSGTNIKKIPGFMPGDGAKPVIKPVPAFVPNAA